FGGCAKESGLPVGSVCADYFMIRRLAGESRAARIENAQALRELVHWTKELGATRILLPLLETSELVTPELVREATESIQSVSSTLDECGIVLGLEMEIPGAEYAQVIRGIGRERVRAYY